MKQKKPTNSLTKLFSKGNPTLDEVLENADLSISIRYEIEELIDFIIPKNCDPNNCPNFINILDYALPIRKEKIQPNLIYRRNAANMLSSICSKLQNRMKQTNLLKERIENFIMPDNKEINNLPEFAGHFQRITETYLRFETKNHNENIFNDKKNFLENILSNVHIISYRFLIANIFSDFPELFFPHSEDKDVMTCVSNYLSRKMSSRKTDIDAKYYLFSIFFQIYQQNDFIFTKFDINCLKYLFDSAISFYKYPLYVFESFRIISLIISQQDQQKVDRIIDEYTQTAGRNLELFAKRSKFNLSNLFRVFWKFLLNNEEPSIDIISVFFENDPYIVEKSDVNWFFYIKVVDVFSKMDSKTRDYYMNKLQIVQKAIKYGKRLNSNSTPNFCILRLIEILAQPLESNEFILSSKPSDQNIMFSNEWAKTVFYAKKILLERKEAVNYAKRDFCQDESSALMF